jgi:hypothetical protein
VFKKFGIVTVGITAGLLAAAPLASAGEAPEHGGHDNGGHHGEHKGGGSDCNVTGGSAEANGGIDGDSFLGNAVAQAPIGGRALVCPGFVRPPTVVTRSCRPRTATLRVRPALVDPPDARPAPVVRSLPRQPQEYSC